MKPDGRIDWHKVNDSEFSSRLAGVETDAWARLALVDGEWWWRLFWNRRFNKWEKCGADRQEASDAANAALAELLATTEEPSPVEPSRGVTDYRGNGGPKFSPQGHLPSGDAEGGAGSGIQWVGRSGD